MRLIDADAIKLPKGFFEKVDNVPKFYEWLNEQPTIDAVPVVRCKDCKHLGTHKSLNVPWCFKMHIDKSEDGYCDSGERS